MKIDTLISKSVDFWWNNVRRVRTLLHSCLFTVKGGFNIIKRNVIHGDGLIASVDYQSKVVIIKIYGMNEDIYDSSSLHHIVTGQLTDIVASLYSAICPPNFTDRSYDKA